jgi:hypothetical protein
MSVITVILEPDADGSLHLPVPAEMQDKKIKVTATLTAVSDVDSGSHDANLKQTQAVAALRRIASRGGLKGIEDPQAWQREIREDRALPGEKGD